MGEAGPKAAKRAGRAPKGQNAEPLFYRAWGARPITVQPPFKSRVKMGAREWVRNTTQVGSVTSRL